MRGSKNWVDVSYGDWHRSRGVMMPQTVNRTSFFMEQIGQRPFGMIIIYCGRRLEWLRLLWQSATLTVLEIPDSFSKSDTIRVTVGYSDTFPIPEGVTVTADHCNNFDAGPSYGFTILFLFVWKVLIGNEQKMSCPSAPRILAHYNDISYTAETKSPTR